MLYFNQIKKTDTYKQHTYAVYGFERIMTKQDTILIKEFYMKNPFSLISAMTMMLFLSGCSAEEAPITYTSIPASEAKALMDSETDYIILDVRTEKEFAEGHIPNAILIPDYDIEARAENELPNKKQLILVY